MSGGRAGSRQAEPPAGGLSAMDRGNVDRLPAEELQGFLQSLLEAAGAASHPAKCAAEIFVEADRKGVGGQGSDYLYYVIDSLRRGLIDGTADPVLVRESEASAVIDGRRGLGQPAALMAVEIVSDKAARCGSATVVVGNSTDIFMIGAYAERIARMGLVGMVMTSGPPLVHPPGGVERLLSTNPIAMAVPRAGEDPLLVDMATSAVSSSRARRAAYRGEQLPAGSGIGADGRPATDAATVSKGALSTLGGYKGFGLSLCVALLCGPLSRSGVGPELGGWQAEGETQTQGHHFHALDPAWFGDADQFRARTEWYLQTIKRSQRAEDVSEIRLPGERGFGAQHEAQHSGVCLMSETWEMLCRYARELDVPIPDLP